jgi:hypothetical protein
MNHYYPIFLPLSLLIIYESQNPMPRTSIQGLPKGMSWIDLDRSLPDPSRESTLLNNFEHLSPTPPSPKAQVYFASSILFLATDAFLVIGWYFVTRIRSQKSLYKIPKVPYLTTSALPFAVRDWFKIGDRRCFTDTCGCGVVKNRGDIGDMDIRVNKVFCVLLILMYSHAFATASGDAKSLLYLLFLEVRCKRCRWWWME